MVKSKRVKTVFNKSSPVCALWAKQSQGSAAYVYYSSGGRFTFSRGPRERIEAVYFSGENLFSYGSHYLLGRLLEFKGQKIAVVNFTRYSNSTSGHSYDARKAAREAGLAVAEVDLGRDTARHFNSSTTDSELIEAIYLSAKNDSVSFYSQLETLGYKPRHSWAVKYLRSEIREFNKKMHRLGLKEFTVEVPEFYFRHCLELAKKLELARENHAKRKQLVLCVKDFSKASTSLPCYSDKNAPSPC